MELLCVVGLRDALLTRKLLLEIHFCLRACQYDTCLCGGKSTSGKAKISYLTSNFFCPLLFLVIIFIPSVSSSSPHLPDLFITRGYV